MNGLLVFDRAAGEGADSKASHELGSDVEKFAAEVVRFGPGCTGVASEAPVLVLVQDFADTADLVHRRDLEHPVTVDLGAVLASRGSQYRAGGLVWIQGVFLIGMDGFPSCFAVVLHSVATEQTQDVLPQPKDWAPLWSQILAYFAAAAQYTEVEIGTEAERHAWVVISHRALVRRPPSLLREEPTGEMELMEPRICA